MRLAFFLAAAAALVFVARMGVAADRTQKDAVTGDPHAGHHVLAPAPATPGDSIYQLSLDLTLQDSRRVPFDQLRGRPVLVAMFYTSCDGVCPLLAFSLRRIVEATPEAQRASFRVLMVSFDPERDTPGALRDFATLHRVNKPSWLFARANENDVRELAAVLGIRYRELPGGVFSHSAVIALLDADGRIKARTTTLQQLDPEFMKAIRALQK